MGGPAQLYDNGNVPQRERQFRREAAGAYLNGPPGARYSKEIKKVTSDRESLGIM